MRKVSSGGAGVVAAPVLDADSGPIRMGRFRDYQSRPEFCHAATAWYTSKRPLLRSGVSGCAGASALAACDRFSGCLTLRISAIVPAANGPLNDGHDSLACASHGYLVAMYTADQ